MIVLLVSSVALLLAGGGLTQHIYRQHKRLAAEQLAEQAALAAAEAEARARRDF